MKFKKCVCTLLLAAMLTLPALADQAGTVTGNGVNLRSSPNSGASVITVISKGTPLTILSSENGWYKVQVHGLTGYMSASYVTVDPDATTVAPRAGTVTGTIANVRAGPSAEHARITQVAAGTKVTVLKEQDGWYQVRLANNQEGWISATLVSVSSTPATTPATTRATTPTTTATTPPSSVGTVTGTSVNLRKEPSTSATIVGFAYSGETLTILSKTGTWYYVQKGSLKAYISADYVKVSNTPVSTTATTRTTTVSTTTTPRTTNAVSGWSGTVTGSVVNLRSGPSTSSTIVGKAYSGEKYSILQASGDWYQIDYGGKQVYIHKDYLKASEVTSSIGYITASVVNVRKEPSSTAQLTGQLRAGTKVTVLGQQNGWYHIISPTKLDGYVSVEYVSLDASLETTATTKVTTTATTTTKKPETTTPPATTATTKATTEFTYVVKPMTDTGIVTGAYVNVRAKPTTDASVLALAAKGKYVDVLGTVGTDWYQIRIGNVTGFISSQYVELGVVEYSRPVGGVGGDTPSSGLVSGLTEPTGDLLLAEKICQYAKEFIGTPYVYGGSLPETGFDCSGFTKYVYAQFGITIPRLQQYNAGTRVAKSDLRPGDLVFFKTGSTAIGHVGIYIGYGQFIHAPAPGKSVCITDLESEYYSTRYVCAVRIVE